MDVITIKNVVPDNMGIVTYQIRAIPLAPSMAAASYRSHGTDHTGKNRITVYPRFCQTQINTMAEGPSEGLTQKQADFPFLFYEADLKWGRY